jgi:hypothetical protein
MKGQLVTCLQADVSPFDHVRLRHGKAGASQGIASCAVTIVDTWGRREMILYTEFVYSIQNTEYCQAKIRMKFMPVNPVENLRGWGYIELIYIGFSWA